METSTTALGDIRVLVVDDSEDMRYLISRVIDRRGGGTWEVVGTASDGREAISQAAATQPDVVVLDIAMPVMDGIEALPLILEAAPGSRVVLVSGFPAHIGKAAADEAGAVGYIEKADLYSSLMPQLESILGAAG